MPLPPLLQHFRIRPRMMTAITAGLLTALLLPQDIANPTRAVFSLDLGGLLFLGLTWHMMVTATPAQMRRQAPAQDAGRITILSLTVGAALFSIGAIGAEMHGLKDLPFERAVLQVGLGLGSILVSWLVTHTIFALHYAHAYYGDAEADGNAPRHRGGLDFPGRNHLPDYWDFLYFAFVIGMTFQTSDVAISAPRIRRLTLAQGVLSFLFNTVILALSVNSVASLL